MFYNLTALFAKLLASTVQYQRKAERQSKLKVFNFFFIESDRNKKYSNYF